MKNSRKRKSKLSDVLINCTLTLILFCVGFVCLFPVNSSITADSDGDRVYDRGNDSDGVSLMFNVYWGEDVLERILDVLRVYEAKATFFVGGSWADDHSDSLLKILNEGHELGNHGYFHKDHSKLDEKGNREEIVACNQYVKLVTGKEIALFAPPSGSYGKTTLFVAAELNMKTILWSRDTIDWRDKNASLIYTRATKNIRGGEFVLMHPMQETADALPDILAYYRKKGLRAVTVSENLLVGG